MTATPRSLRLDDEVLAALNALPGLSHNDKLRGLLFDRKPETGGESMADRAVFETLELVQGIAAKMEERGQSSFSAPSSGMNHCIHCQKSRPRPAGTRPSSICQQCRTAGHWNTGNCPKCAERDRLRDLAAGDSTAAAVERSDVVYDA